MSANSALSSMKSQPVTAVVGVGLAITAYFMLRDPNSRNLVRAQTGEVPSRLVRTISDGALKASEPFGNNSTARHLRRELP